MGLNYRLLPVVMMLAGMCAFVALFSYIAPFFFGVVIAVLVDPAVNYCECKGCPRPAAALLLVLVVFSGFLLMLAAAAAGLWHEIGQLAGYVQALYEGNMPSFDWFDLLIERLPVSLQNLLPSVISSVSHFAINFLGEVLNYITKIPAFLVSWLMAGTTAFFVSRDKRAIVRFITAQLPENWRRVVYKSKHTILQNVFAYLKTQLTLMWVSICIAVSGFLLADHPYAWILGILAGLLDLIPWVGPGGVFLPAVVYNLARGLVGRGVFLASVWFVLLLMRQFYEPRMIRDEIGLHPLFAMAGIYLGVRLMGGWGVILGPLALILLKSFYVIVKDLP